jgi:small subunit ribosomal protein S16
MAVKIRLQRQGKKDRSFFHIVVADGRAPRDGKFIEKLGTYFPHTNPATIDINFESALDWLQKGAQPTDTCKAILSYKGVMMKNHLAIGVKKGAMTQEQADAKFAKWIAEKEAKVTGKVDKLVTEKKTAYSKMMAAEKAAKESKAAKIVAKNTPPPAAVAEVEAPAAEAAAPSEETNA